MADIRHYKHSFLVTPRVEKMKFKVHAVLSQLELKTGREIKAESPSYLSAQGLEDDGEYAWIDGYELNIAIDELTNVLKTMRVLAKR